mmetsp:Transcript_2187/g.5166  ORF Transcript_2187/g.5166 Transcript_2187/m.5166 type:complete len:232 (-) Transcript_2187:384-1079(-)
MKMSHSGQAIISAVSANGSWQMRQRRFGGLELLLLPPVVRPPTAVLSGGGGGTLHRTKVCPLGQKASPSGHNSCETGLDSVLESPRLGKNVDTACNKRGLAILIVLCCCTWGVFGSSTGSFGEPSPVAWEISRRPILKAARNPLGASKLLSSPSEQERLEELREFSELWRSSHSCTRSWNSCNIQACVCGISCCAIPDSEAKSTKKEAVMARRAMRAPKSPLSLCLLCSSL